MKRREGAGFALVSVAVQSDRDLIRIGLGAVIRRHPGQLIDYGPERADEAEVLVIDAHAAAHASGVRGPAAMQPRVVHLVESSADAVVSPNLATLTLETPEMEIVEILLRAGVAGRIEAREGPSRNWLGAAVGLTRRESDVLGLLANGLTNEEIAQALFINIETVKSHLKRAYLRLGVRNRAEAVGWIVGGQPGRRDAAS